MPYIDPEQRDELDPAITLLEKALLQRLVGLSSGDTLSMAGKMNYVITRLIVDIFCQAKFHVGGLRYANIALATGVLENVKQEMYRRLAAPYEDAKCAENGDVY